MRPKTNQLESGFTLIEILVATLLVGILLASVVAPMTGLFGISRDTNGQLASVTSAQNVMEQAKGLWRTQALYDRDCLKNVSFTNVTITVIYLDSGGNPVESAITPSNSATCDATTLSATFSAVPIKRVTVSSGTGNAAAVLRLDISRPE